VLKGRLHTVLEEGTKVVFLKQGSVGLQQATLSNAFLFPFSTGFLLSGSSDEISFLISLCR
jgi:hypothetical protein